MARLLASPILAKLKMCFGLSTILLPDASCQASCRSLEVFLVCTSASWMRFWTRLHNPAGMRTGCDELGRVRSTCAMKEFKQALMLRSISNQFPTVDNNAINHFYARQPHGHGLNSNMQSSCLILNCYCLIYGPSPTWNESPLIQLPRSLGN